jgi:hypothetical protein
MNRAVRWEILMSRDQNVNGTRSGARNEEQAAAERAYHMLLTIMDCVDAESSKADVARARQEALYVLDGWDRDKPSMI